MLTRAWRSQGLLRRKTTVYRSSRMTKQQADSLYELLGLKCRLGMYVATTTAKSAAKDVREWQEEEEGAEIKYMVRFCSPTLSLLSP